MRRNNHCPIDISNIPGVIIVYPISENERGRAWMFVKLKSKVAMPGSKKYAMLGTTKLGNILATSI